MWWGVWRQSCRKNQLKDSSTSNKWRLFSPIRRCLPLPAPAAVAPSSHKVLQTSPKLLPQLAASSLWGTGYPLPVPPISDAGLFLGWISILQSFHISPRAGYRENKKARSLTNSPVKQGYLCEDGESGCRALRSCKDSFPHFEGFPVTS